VLPTNRQILHEQTFELLFDIKALPSNKRGVDLAKYKPLHYPVILAQLLDRLLNTTLEKQN